MANAAEAAEIVAGLIAGRPLSEWVDVLSRGHGQWSVVQDAWEVGRDAALRANGMISSVTDADGVQRELVASPVQFDEEPIRITRAPSFAEHTDEVLRECGFTEGELIQLKIDGAIT